MATFTDTIRFVVEATTGQAKAQLEGLKGSLNQAEGAGGKLKAAAGSIGGALRDNLALGLAGAGGAVTAFATKAIGEFQDLALEADKMAVATGLAVEDASRWNEVAGDLGVNVDAVAGAMNRLNRAAAEGKLAEVGIDAADANERFIETLQLLAGITDETRRAQLAQELLGRSWTELAPLIQSAEGLKAALEGVSDAKVIDQDEVDKAKRYRDAMDELKGVTEDLTLVAGEALVPALATVADTIVQIQGAIEDLTGTEAFKAFSKFLGFLGVGNTILELPGQIRERFQPLIGRDRDFGVRSTATIDPNATPNPGASQLAPTIGTQIVNMAPGVDGSSVSDAQRNFWQSNGRVTWTGQ